MKIIVDTNAIFGDFRLQGTKIVSLCSSARTTGNSVYLPEIVLMESINQFREQLISGKQAIDKGIKQIIRSSGPALTNPITDTDINIEVEKLSDFLRSRVRELSITILPIPNPSHRDLISQDLARKKPFNDTGKGYRDALIWANTQDLCSVSNGIVESPQVVLISDNHTDFCNNNKYELHDDLKVLLEKRGLDSDSVRIMKDIDSFIDEYLKDKQQKLGDIKTALKKSTTYGHINFSKELQERIENYMHLRTIDDEDTPFPGKPYCDFTVSGVNDEVEFSIIDVRLISDDEVLIEIEANADCEIDFFMDKSEYYTMDEKDMPYIIDSDWNRHVVAASDSTVIRLTISLIVDLGFTEILSEDIEIVPAKFLILDGSY